MSRQAKNIIKLAAVFFIVVVLGGVYLWSSRRTGNDEPVEETPPPESYVLSDREEADVQRIYVSYKNGETLAFLPGEQAEDLFGSQFVWYLADRPDYVLDRFRVNDVLRAAFTLNTTHRVHEETSGLYLADFGLDPPVVTLTVHYDEGSTAVLHLGNPTPDGTRHFFMVDGDPAMYLVPNHIGRWMQLTLEDIISRQIPPVIDEENITFFRVAQRGRELIEFVEMSDDDIDPILLDMGVKLMAVHLPATIEGRPVDSFQIRRGVMEGFLENFRLNEIVAVEPDDLAPYGLDDPFIDFHYDSDGGSIHLLFGDTFSRDIDNVGVPHIYVKFADRPHVFVAQADPVRHLTDLNAIQFIAGRFIALINILEVERIVITSDTHPERNLEMIINHDPDEDSHAIFPTINGYPILESSFRVLYRLLIGISADTHIDPFPPEGVPEFAVTFHMLDGTSTTTEYFYYDANFFSFSVDGEDVWAVTNRRNVEMFFNEAASRIDEVR